MAAIAQDYSLFENDRELDGLLDQIEIPSAFVSGLCGGPRGSSSILAGRIDSHADSID